jgi:hypothetical protein
VPGNDRNRNGGVTVHADLNRARSPRRVKSQLAAEHLVVGDHELDRLTLWIAAAAGLTMIVMFALGRNWGEAGTACSSSRTRWPSPLSPRRCRP